MQGTLGVITAVGLLCPPRPKAVHVAYLACPSFDAAQRALAAAKQRLGEVLSAFEFMDRASLDMVLTHLPGAVDPLPGSNDPFYLVSYRPGEQHAPAVPQRPPSNGLPARTYRS